MGERIEFPRSLVFFDSSCGVGFGGSFRLVLVRRGLFLGPFPGLLLGGRVARGLEYLAGLDQRERAVGVGVGAFASNDGARRLVE